MKAFTQLAPEEQQRFEAASTWQLRMAEDPSLEVSPEFQDWLTEPANQKAFAGVNMAWKSGDEFAVEPAILDMRQAALRRARRASTGRWLPAAVLKRAAAAVLAVCLLGGGTAYYLLTAPAVYATETGERRVVSLPDGSRITLDSDTEVRVRYLSKARELTLDRGRARFDVAHDVSRPFTVTAGTQTVVAVGTRFDVEKIGSKVLVTLIQGRIVVKETVPSSVSASLPRPVSLVAGEELIASRDAKRTIKVVTPQIVTAWQSGRLVFNGDTLAEAVERVNRYTDHPIEVDPAVASIRIIGAFNAGDVSSFVSAVTSYFPIQATTTADNDILLEPRS